MTLHIWPSDYAVLDRVLEAVQAPATGRNAQVLCRNNGCNLGTVRGTELGPLFESRPWTVELPLGYRMELDGHGRLARRPTYKAWQSLTSVTEHSGPPVEAVERHGTIALLALPPAMNQNYPDLLVRCKHGDAVLDRLEVLNWLREGKAPRVRVSFPRHGYVRPSLDQHPHRARPQQVQERRVWTLGGRAPAAAALPRAGELEAFLASQEAPEDP